MSYANLFRLYLFEEIKNILEFVKLFYYCYYYFNCYHYHYNQKRWNFKGESGHTISSKTPTANNQHIEGRKRENSG